MKVYYARIERETIWTSLVEDEVRDFLENEPFDVMEDFEYVKIGAKNDMSFPFECKLVDVEKIVKGDVFLVYQDGETLHTAGAGNWGGSYHDGWTDAHTEYVVALVHAVIVESYRG